MAFQPIVDANTASVWGYEALIRGTAGEGAGAIMGRVQPEQRYKFDQACRVKAIDLAARLFPLSDGRTPRLSINFLPNAVYEPAACLRATLAAARKSQFPREAIMFEFTENESVRDTDHLRSIISEYRRQGFTTAIDDFGAGYAGLSLLADFQPDLIKLDMELIRDIDTNKARQAIIAGVMQIAGALDITVLAEGIESEAEFRVLRDAGVGLFQGYWFAKPGFETLPALSNAGSQALRPAA
ncbi:EAL domain-containing protein [Tianweitania sp. BSSL-BM11]|uniref:EAL domain-containing protein n=2 Tax=Tianweitania aestuarii TaxID=2814886 RepID=A0ABS5S1J0_9HYPH|nr:EAL domain-containing protein [Tianweitania aestuarii]